MSTSDRRRAHGSEPGEVALLLVTHDGARWLPAVLEGIVAQRAPIAHTMVVDTGSTDESVALVEAALGPDVVVRAPAATSYSAAVALGLDELATRGAAPEWVWLLHDDSNPHPDALLALLAGAYENPDADVLGPMLREWPSLKRLLELGVTVTASGRRETGLEAGEYDQGQYYLVRPTLAVNTAGMLVRREALETLGGLDEALPLFGNDLDFGWRAASAGFQTVVVPQAVVFHAEAAKRGLRRTDLTGARPHYRERQAAFFTLLANSRGPTLPLRVVRMAFGVLVRVLGLLLVRAPGDAWDEARALGSVLVRPGRIAAARRRRRPEVVDSEENRARVKRLLAPWWLPYRHGLDFVGEVITAATQQAADVAERRRAAAAERDPASFAARRIERDQLDDDELPRDTGLVARFVTNPVALLLTVVVALALVGARDAFGPVAGGGLSPTPETDDSWWRTYVESWHPVGQGSAVPAPAYLAPLALLASVLLGSPAAAVSVLMVLAVPVTLWGAWRFLRVAGRLASESGASRWLILWGATTYALVPVVAGAWSDGRLGPVVAAALLPWLAHAALGFAEPAADRRWRAAWRTGLLLSLLTAFTPAAWWVVALLAATVVGTAAAVLRQRPTRSVWAPPAVAVGVPLALLLPWWLPALVHGAGEGLLLDPGRPNLVPPDGLALLLGRYVEQGAPVWWAWLLPVAAVLALLPRRTRAAVLLCWLVAAVAAVAAGLLALVDLDLAGQTVAAGLGFPLVLLQGAFVTAAVLGLLGLRAALAADAAGTHGRRLRAATTAVVAAAVSVVPVAGLAWFVLESGTSLERSEASDIPAYMVQNAERGPEHGVLVVRGDVRSGLRYDIRRGDGVTLGEDEILTLTAEDDELTGRVTDLLARPTPQAVEAIAERGVEYVVLPAPADADVAAGLDATTGLVQASAADRATRAWRVEPGVPAGAVDGPSSPLRVALLVLQGVGVVVVLVLAAPSVRRRPS